MDFGRKLQELRRSMGLTQEELAARIYVSRTAVSKWESGRGYPSIDSLKAIADFFSVTVDDLLSSREVLAAAEENQKRTEKRFLDLVFGLLDVFMLLLLFLPLFAVRGEGVVTETALVGFCGAPLARAVYYVLALATAVFGILTLSLQGWSEHIWLAVKGKISIALGAASVLAFVIGLQPYAAVFAFMLLSVKVILLIKWH